MKHTYVKKERKTVHHEVCNALHVFNQTVTQNAYVDAMRSLAIAYCKGEISKEYHKTQRQGMLSKLERIKSFKRSK